MLLTHLLALLLLPAILVAWVAVQTAWRRAFCEYGTDPDALALRRGAGRCCGCLSPACRRRSSAPAEEQECQS